MRNRANGTLTVAFDQRLTTGTATQIRVSTNSSALPPIMLRFLLLFGASCTSCADVSVIFSFVPRIARRVPEFLALLLVGCVKYRKRLFEGMKSRKQA